MYAMVLSLKSRALAVEQVVLLGVSLVIAELFYKFHSFTLECAAFLATWFVLGAVAHFVRPRTDRPARETD